MEVLDFGCWNGVVEIKSYPGTCRVGKLIIVGSWNCVVEIKSYQGTCRMKIDDCFKLVLSCCIKVLPEGWKFLNLDAGMVLLKLSPTQAPVGGKLMIV